MVVLLCPVRGCRQPLASADRRLVCPRAHSFDVARRGYVNLLQSHDRQSRHPGDSTEAVRARARLRAHGIERQFVEAIARLVAVGPESAALDIGCGDGAHVAAVVARTGCEGHGLDISVAAIEAAAREHPELRWVVANADRFLPYADGSFGAVLSITSRVNAAEFRRVMREDGRLAIVVPGPEDLIELRAAVLGEGVERDRTPRVIRACAPFFTLERRERLRGRERLDAATAADALTASYRGLRPRQRARTASLGIVDVTLAREVLIFRPARRGVPPGAARRFRSAGRGALSGGSRTWP
ncbi:MAG TPA: methyltransferase domain-containing protein [Methylomirabilota bacterium]